MNYTIIPKQLIYKRKTLDRLAEQHPLNATLIRRLMKYERWKEQDPEIVISPCLNTAYYICTIMRMEIDPSLRLNSYKTIARQGYIEGRNIIPQCVTLSLVAILIEHSTSEWQIKLHDIAIELWRFAKSLVVYEEVELADAPGTKYTKIIKLLGLPDFIGNSIDDSWLLPDELFQPRTIDVKAWTDLMRHDPTFNWDRWLLRRDDDELYELIANLGKTQEEKKILIWTIWGQIHSARTKLELPIQPIKSLLQEYAREFCPDFCMDIPGLFDTKNTDDNSQDVELQSIIDQQASKIKELETELEQLRQQKQDKSDEQAKETLDYLEDWQKLSTRELSIFFSQALGVSFNPELINQKQLANLAAQWTKPQPDTIRTKVINLYNEEVKVNNDSSEDFSPKTKDEALNVYYYIIKIAKYYSSITPQMSNILDNINLIYHLKIDEEMKKKIFETIDKKRKSGEKRNNG